MRAYECVFVSEQCTMQAHFVRALRIIARVLYSLAQSNRHRNYGNLLIHIICIM